MTAGGGDFERPLGLALATNLVEVGKYRRILAVDRSRSGQHGPATNVSAHFQKGACGKDVSRTDQRRFARAFPWQDEGLAAPSGLQGHGQRPPDRAQFTRKREFPGEFAVIQRRCGDLAAGGEHSEGDRQVEAARFLVQKILQSENRYVAI